MLNALYRMAQELGIDVLYDGPVVALDINDGVFLSANMTYEGTTHVVWARTLEQAELAQRVGASRKWVVEVEKGKPRAEIGLLIRTLDALGLRLSINDERTATAGKTAGGTPVPTVDLDRLLDSARDKRK